MKTKKLFLMMIAAAAMIFAGCKEDEEEIVPVLDVDKTAIAAAATADTYTVAVTSNVMWTATVNGEAITWCTLANASGNSNGMVTVNVAENPTAGVERIATVTFTASTLTRTVTVTQAAVAPVLTTDITAVAAAYTAGTYDIAVTSNATWTASVNSEATAWCTAAPESSTDNGTVTVNVAENPLVESRAAIITFTTGTLTHTVTVTQAAAMPVLTAAPTTIAAAYTAGMYGIDVTSNVAWTASINTAWCTVGPESGTGSYMVAVNVTENPLVEPRTATITFTAGTLTLAVSVTQDAYHPYTVSEDNNAPTNAQSNKVWVFNSSTLIWSDVIQIPECDKNNFTIASTPNCRSYTEDGKTRYYYNWPYVNANAATMCPSPWRVPSREDFVALVAATNATILETAWGYGGTASMMMLSVSSQARYWSSTEDSSNTSNAYSLSYTSDEVNAEASVLKTMGHQVRCVK
jgi:hypothetical protein